MLPVEAACVNWAHIHSGKQIDQIAKGIKRFGFFR
jgi:hypothetical protein